jgi:hypothetical protein
VLRVTGALAFISKTLRSTKKLLKMGLPKSFQLSVFSLLTTFFLTPLPVPDDPSSSVGHVFARRKSARKTEGEEKKRGAGCGEEKKIAGGQGGGEEKNNGPGEEQGEGTGEDEKKKQPAHAGPERDAWLWDLSQGEWVEDGDCENCTDCKAKFSMLKRKHHCRWCGGIFCSECSRHTVQAARIGREHAKGNESTCRVCEGCNRGREDGGKILRKRYELGSGVFLTLRILEFPRGLKGYLYRT